MLLLIHLLQHYVVYLTVKICLTITEHFSILIKNKFEYQYVFIGSEIKEHSFAYRRCVIFRGND